MLCKSVPDCKCDFRGSHYGGEPWCYLNELPCLSLINDFVEKEAVYCLTLDGYAETIECSTYASK